MGALIGGVIGLAVSAVVVAVGQGSSDTIGSPHASALLIGTAIGATIGALIGSANHSP